MLILATKCLTATQGLFQNIVLFMSFQKMSSSPGHWGLRNKVGGEDTLACSFSKPHQLSLVPLCSVGLCENFTPHPTPSQTHTNCIPAAPNVTRPGHHCQVDKNCAQGQSVPAQWGR